MLFKSSKSDKNTKEKEKTSTSYSGANSPSNQVFTFIDNMPYEAKTITLSQEELDKLKEQQKNTRK